MGIGAPELLILVILWFVLLAGAVYALYWVVRLAVRHGVLDAHRQLPVEQLTPGQRET